MFISGKCNLIIFFTTTNAFKQELSVIYTALQKCVVLDDISINPYHFLVQIHNLTLSLKTSNKT